MKRVLLAVLILSAGTTVFCALRHSANVTRGEVAAQRHDWQSRTQHLTELRIEQRQITEQWSEAKRQLATQLPLPVLTELAEKILAGAAPENYSAAERERLLAELGFSWNTTGDYLIVSKKSLEAISFATLQESTITEAARAALAITPTEQATLQASTERLKQERIEWVKANAQREEPSGSILAKYTLPEDSSLAQQQSSTFTNAVLSTLGQARGGSLSRQILGLDGRAGIVEWPGLRQPRLITQHRARTCSPRWFAVPSQIRLLKYDRRSFSMAVIPRCLSPTVPRWLGRTGRA